MTATDSILWVTLGAAITTIIGVVGSWLSMRAARPEPHAERAPATAQELERLARELRHASESLAALAKDRARP